MFIIEVIVSDGGVVLHYIQRCFIHTIIIYILNIQLHNTPNTSETVSTKKCKLWAS